MTIKRMTEIAAIITTVLALAIAVMRVIEAVKEATDKD